MINSETLKAIDASFGEAMKTNKKIQRLYKRIRDGTANFVDAGDFAKEVGSVLSSAFKQHISVETLPNGRLTWQIGNEIVKPKILKGYNVTAVYFENAQSILFKKRGLNLSGAPPDVNESRIDGFLTELYSDTYDKTGWILEDPAYLQNYFEAVIDTGLKNNVGMLGEAGIRATITREIDAGACPWCMNLAGSYEYGKEPDDVYRRHRDCHCRVVYEIPEGFRQDSWSKNWFKDNPKWQLEQKKRVEWSQISNGYEKRGVNRRYVAAGRLTPAEAKQLEQILLNK